MGSKPRFLLDEAECPACGYSLRGLRDSGTCPECGRSYSPETVALFRNPPGALEMFFQVGWPLLPFAFFSTLALLDVNSGGGGMACVSLLAAGAMVPIMAIVVPVASHRLIRANLPPFRRSRYVLVNLWRLGPAPTAAALFSLLVLVLVPLFILWWL